MPPVPDTPPLAVLPPAERLPDGRYNVTVVFLEMDTPPVAAPRPIPEGVSIHLVEQPSVALYRLLYDEVGRDWLWVERKRLNDIQLQAVIQDPRNEIVVAMQGDNLVGYYELDRRRWPTINLSYFGLTAPYIGKGIGRPLLDHAIHRAWSHDPAKLTVNTCNLDHTSALPLYQLHGFRPYTAKEIVFDASV